MITYGTDATIVKRFGRSDPSPEDLKKLVQGLPESRGPPDFDEVLDAAKNVFEGAGLRSNALKVSVSVVCFVNMALKKLITNFVMVAHREGLY